MGSTRVTNGHKQSLTITNSPKSGLKSDPKSGQKSDLKSDPKSGQKSDPKSGPKFNPKSGRKSKITNRYTLQIVCIFFFAKSKENLKFFSKKATKCERKFYLQKLLKIFKIL